MDILTLPDGYSRSKVAPTSTYRRMTVAEAKTLCPGSEHPFHARDGTVRRCRVSGAPKTWKTRPAHVRVPITYGMYESGYAESYKESESDPVSFLLVRVT
jgi:hypothetical protein